MGPPGRLSRNRGAAGLSVRAEPTGTVAPPAMALPAAPIPIARAPGMASGSSRPPMKAPAAPC
eukprot:9892369-Alexandrium_andersonii.AAC.1